MAYTVADIIENLIAIEKNAMEVYYAIANKFKDSTLAVSIIARALGKEEEKHVHYYEALKEELKTYKHDEIDFYLYDKAAKLLYEFKQRIQLPEVETVQELLRYALDFEKNNVGLLLDIQGRLVENAHDVTKTSYEMISKMIEEEREHEKELERLLQK